jgi:hypothetical protein
MTVFVDNISRDLALNNFQENRHSIPHCCPRICHLKLEFSSTFSLPIPVDPDFHTRRYQELPETPAIRIATHAATRAVPAAILWDQLARILVDRTLPAADCITAT